MFSQKRTNTRNRRPTGPSPRPRRPPVVQRPIPRRNPGPITIQPFPLPIDRPRPIQRIPKVPKFIKNGTRI